MQKELFFDFVLELSRLFAEPAHEVDVGNNLENVGDSLYDFKDKPIGSCDEAA